VISFSYLWGGDTESSAVSSVVIYLFSLIITPFLTLIFLGKAVSEFTLLYYLGAQICIPIVLSRVARRFITSAKLRSILINICFFVLVIAVMGGSRALIFSAGLMVLYLAVFAAVRTFGVGIIYQRYSFKKGVLSKNLVTETLFSTYKNTGMAASLALVLLGPEAALPAAVCMVIEVFWLIFAGKFLFHRNSQESN
jgi:bile acid:Na+ symporter, BASS family